MAGSSATGSFKACSARSSGAVVLTVLLTLPGGFSATTLVFDMRLDSTSRVPRPFPFPTTFSSTLRIEWSRCSSPCFDTTPSKTKLPATVSTILSMMALDAFAEAVGSVSFGDGAISSFVTIFAFCTRMKRILGASAWCRGSTAATFAGSTNVEAQLNSPFPPDDNVGATTAGLANFTAWGTLLTTTWVRCVLATSGASAKRTAAAAFAAWAFASKPATSNSSSSPILRKSSFDVLSAASITRCPRTSRAIRTSAAETTIPKAATTTRMATA